VRIVLDTGCLVTAVRSSSGASAEVLRTILREEIVLLMNLNLALEYRAVAVRKEHLLASVLRKAEILDLIDALEAFAEPVEVFWKMRPMSEDPNDDMVLDVAINGRASALVTNNVKHFAAAGKRFGIAVLRPAELLQKLRKG